MTDGDKIDTGGGTYAAGDVSTGGDFVGRDKNVGGDEIHGDSHTGDKITFSGNFEGAIVNVKSTLSHVSQQINRGVRTDEETRAKLARLVSLLEETLAQVPAEQQEEAGAVADLTQNLVEAAAAEKPNKTMVRISGEALKEAARNLAAITPDALAIATEIAATIVAITA